MLRPSAWALAQHDDIHHVPLAAGLDQLHSRKLRGFAEVAFQ